MPINVSDYLTDAPATMYRDSLNETLASMQGSRILAAAAEAKALKATGVDVCDLTVGDYAPEQFKAPASFLSDLTSEIEVGRNHYPPSDGIPELQQAILKFYERELDVRFPNKSVVICGGARPPIYAVFRALVKPRDKVAFSVPCWNMDYYTYLCEAIPKIIPTSAESNFLPTVEQVAKQVGDKGVHLFCLNSPLNPCGTVTTKETLAGICQVIVDENRKRLAFGWRPVYMLFDQVYWPLTYGDHEFHHPIELVPEIAPWVIYIDAISKWMVGTGLRLGWAVVPPPLYEPLRDFMGHVGGWAPRPVQVATANFLNDVGAFAPFREELRTQLLERLSTVHTFFANMQEAGLPVESMVPQGAIYTSVRFNVIGKKTPQGVVLNTNNDIRQYLLRETHVALVAFQAFSLWEETGWFRISVGAVSTEALQSGLLRLREGIAQLS